MASIFYLSFLLVMLAVSDAAAQATREQIARGKYVFGAAAGCGCHTVAKQPLNAGGRKYDGPFGTVYSSNITPDPQTARGGAGGATRRGLGGHVPPENGRPSSTTGRRRTRRWGR